MHSTLSNEEDYNTITELYGPEYRDIIINENKNKISTLPTILQISNSNESTLSSTISLPSIQSQDNNISTNHSNINKNNNVSIPTNTTIESTTNSTNQSTTSTQLNNEIKTEDDDSLIRKYIQSQLNNTLDSIKKNNFNLTIREMKEKYGNDGEDAIRKEIKQMEDMQVWIPVDKYDDGELIPCSCINKAKVNNKNEIIKLKSRLVAGGHRQLTNPFTNNSSPTLTISSLFTLCNIALQNNMKIITADVVGAYLNADLKENIYMKLNKEITKYLINLKPEYKKYLNQKEEIVVKLKKALYGLKQSGKLWYEKLNEILLSIGFNRNLYDKCVYNMKRGHHNIIIAVYVDDLFILTEDDADQTWLINKLKENIKDITINKNNKFTYLGMEFNISNRNEITINNTSYIKKILEEEKIYEKVNTPTSNKLFVENELEELLNEEEQNKLRSITYKLMYLSTRIRPDISIAVNHLCTKLNKYKESDKEKINRILKYLNETMDKNITFNKKIIYQLICTVTHHMGLIQMVKVTQEL